MPTRDSPTVLVVDDEKGMRTVVTCLLEAMGITSLEVEGAKRALETISERRNSIAACVLDMNLGKDRGEEVYDRIYEISPELPVFPMSGICEAEMRARFGSRPVAGFITKPFSASEFASAISGALPQ